MRIPVFSAFIRFFALPVVGVFLSFDAEAQLYQKYREHGDAALKTGNYTSAVRYYNRALELDSAHPDLLFNYAEALRFTNRYRKSLYYYLKTAKADRGRKFTRSYHYAADLHKILGNYSAAAKYHDKFTRVYKGDPEIYEVRKSKFEMSAQSTISHLVKYETDKEISNDYDVNTGFSEFAACFSGDSLMLYSSLRSDSLKNRLVLDTLNYYSKIYTSVYKEGWMEGTRYSEMDDSGSVHVANAVYSPKSDFIYYNECLNGVCKIFRARNIEGVLSGFEELPANVNKPGTSNSQPFTARIDGFDYLFFASDRENGYGKMDIWYTIIYSNGLFEEPGNLGGGINSPGNEICPFYMHEENSLYFSSDWYEGLGGFDIFKSVSADNKFGLPENLGKPYNSSYNDLYFRYANHKGVITSNRTGSRTDKYENCCNDLFFFEYHPHEIKPQAEMSAIEKINRLLPLRLYFDNDQPNPRSEDTTTTFLYSALYINYMSRLGQFRSEYVRGLKKEESIEASGEIERFFEGEIKLGFEDLKTALGLMLLELRDGKKLEIAIKGYASPLSASAYNKNLTLRRISAVENEIRHYSKELEGFIDSGHLKIKHLPFGEDKAIEGVSDDSNDKRNAIYSKRASFERRVEIISAEAID